MRFDGWKLGCIELWWLGVIYSPNHQNDRWWRLLSNGAPDTVRCASHITRPLGSDRWSFWQRGHRTVTVHCPVRLLAPALTSARAVALFTVHCSVADDRCSAWHTGQSGATSDSPVNYSGAASPNSRRWQVWSGTPWCTGHCPVRQTRAAYGLSFALFIWTISWTFYWFVLNLWHL
jgi:hypothetical protein